MFTLLRWSVLLMALLDQGVLLVGEEQIKCHKPVDVIIILDGSGSVTQVNWIKSLQFAGSLAANILSLKPQANKVGIVEFSQVAREAVPLTSERQSVDEGIKRLTNQYQNGITRTELGLLEAERMFKKDSLDYDDKVLIIVSDGKITPKNQQPGADLIYQPIADLKKIGVRIIAVSVTPQADIAVLNLMVLSPSDVLKMNGYEELLERVSQITQMACPTPKPTSPTTQSTVTSPTTPSPTTPATQPSTIPTPPTAPTPSPTTPTTPSPTTPSGHPQDKCESPYHKIGCFIDDLKAPRPLPDMLFTDRDTTSPMSSGKTIDWANWETYLVDIVCRCSKAAKEKGYSLFSIQYYGECWSGKNAGETYKRNGKSSQCTDKKTQACSNDNLNECAGQQETNYVYGLDQPANEPTCDIQYEKLGCFKDNMQISRPLSELIFTDRDPSSNLYSGTTLSWGDWDTYMPALVCRCAEKATQKGFKYFGIQYYGECWAGGETYGQNGQTDTCVTSGYEACPANPRDNKTPCVGKQYTNYVYGVKSSAPTTCDIKYHRLGCYSDLHASPRPLPQLILTDRDETSAVSSKKIIEWGDWDQYIRDLVCRCARLAQQQKLMVIGIQNYGECWSGPEGAGTYAINGESSNCVTDGYNPCLSNSTECVGKDNANSVYRIPF